MTSDQQLLLVSLAKAQLQLDLKEGGHRSVFFPDDPEYPIVEDLVEQGYAYVLTWGVVSNQPWVHYQVSREGWDFLENFHLL